MCVLQSVHGRLRKDPVRILFVLVGQHDDGLSKALQCALRVVDSAEQVVDCQDVRLLFSTSTSVGN